MIIYILDKNNLSKKDVLETTGFNLELDEETNATSIITLFRKPNANQNDFILIKNKDKTIYQGIIEQIQGEKNTSETTLNCIDISNIFDRKVYVDNLELMDTSLEDFLYYSIQKFFKNGDDDSQIAMNYLTIIQETKTNVKEQTNAENGLYNFHTFMTNCRQNKNISTDFKLTEDEIIVTIKNIENDKTIIIDTTNNDVYDYNKTYETEITAKVSVVCGDTGNIINYYLLNDRTTTTDKNDPNRAEGEIETIYVDEEERAREEALNIFNGNRYNHLVEFSIKKDSKLVNIEDLYIGRKIRIKTNDSILNSYISSISITNDSKYIRYKSGNIRINLIDKLKQNPYQVNVDKVDKASIKNTKSTSTTQTYSCDYINQIGGGDSQKTTPIDYDSNLNDFIENGIYYLRGEYTHNNMPSGVSNGWLFVAGNGSKSTQSLKQILFRHGTVNTTDRYIYVRTYFSSSNTWGKWNQLIQEDDINYKNGDKLFGTKNDYRGFAGFTTASSKHFRFIIQVSKSLKNIRSFTVDTSTLQIRQNNNYLCEGGTWKSTTISSVNISKINDYMIELYFITNGVPTNTQNNSLIYMTNMDITFNG